jgi:hypothetical protein
MEHEKPMEIEEILFRFHGCSLYSSVDIVKAYWQVPLREEDKQYTGFSMNGTTYVFNVLPFGLATALSSFVRAMTSILGEEILQFVIIYVDDCLVASSSLEIHLEHLDRLLTRLKQAGMTVNLKKSTFLKDEIRFVGHKITSEGIFPLSSTMKQITQFPTPKTTRQLKKFLGTCVWVSKFIPHFSTLAAPLYDVTKLNKWKWSDKINQSFDTLKSVVSKIEILKHPDPSKKIYIQTDASLTALAAVMFQIGNKGEKEILQFASRRLSKPERSYAAVEIEALAVIFAVQRWKVYLIGTHFCVRTDHQALQFMKLCKPPNARLVRFLLYLQQFSFEIEHVKGEENFLADFLSRFPDQLDPQEKFIQPSGRTIQVFKVSVQKELLFQLRNLVKEQDKDVTIKCLKNSILNNNHKDNTYLIFNDILFRKDEANYLIMLPEKMIEMVIRAHHDDFGHFGIKRTTHLIQQTFYIPNVRKLVKKFVRKCEICQKAKWNNQPQSTDFRSVVTSDINDLWSVDLLGPLPRSRGGVQYVLVIYDVFSKLVRLNAIKKATTRAILIKIRQAIDELGKPKRILSDNGTQFTSKTYKKQLAEWEIQISYTAVRHPSANPVERIMKELGRLGRSYCNESHKAWAIYLPLFQLWLNNVFNFVTNYCPNQIAFGSRENEIRKRINFPSPPTSSYQITTIREETKKNIQRCAETRAAKNQRHQEPDFHEGELVLIKKDAYSSAEKGEIKKFHLLYEGPFKIFKIIHSDTFLLGFIDSKKIRGIFNRNLLKRFVN